ncbi:MAG: FAD-binding oxidoreductase [Melioribacteraceae bacterium]|nr:FAD-binding oxidoreductase [Melioribacteraceae bacterium]
MSHFSHFRSELEKILSDEQITDDYVKCYASGTDASLYRLTPKLVAKVQSENEIIALIKSANQNKVPITFRAAGTSLSGQAITDSVLVKTGWKFNRFSFDEKNQIVTVQPDVIGGKLNVFLSKFGRKFGPDPASIDSAKIGGIIANNSSGLRSGIENNCYNTLVDLRLIFADGQILDTNDEESRKLFVRRNPELINGLSDLKRKIEKDPSLTAKIQKKYQIKNTMGYGLNSFLDFEDPLEILKHLLVGSEGTLAFISSATFKTIPSLPYKSVGLMLFDNLEKACQAAVKIKELKPGACELMDNSSLKAVQYLPGADKYLLNIGDQSSALLIEIEGISQIQLTENESRFESIKERVSPNFFSGFLSDKTDYDNLWRVRKGLFASVGAARRPGTSIIIEDICFNTSDLTVAVSELRTLLDKNGYQSAVIFGHAMDGNIHFVFDQNFSDPKELKRYDKMMDEIFELVINKFDGSLKAEHGTGRNMGPFVKKEWGKNAYEIMKEIKKLFDPNNILNPGVLINDDPFIHIKNLKNIPLAHEEIDECIECGFCESKCPSNDLTFTPRERISVFRELNRLKNSNADPELINKFKKVFNYSGLQTCATDGLCKTACPVGIDTGDLIKDLRSENNSKLSNITAQKIADNFATATTIIRFGLKINSISKDLVPQRLLQKIPGWQKDIPIPATKLEMISTQNSNLQIIYFPSCVSRIFGPAEKHTEDQKSVIVKVLKKLGYDVIIPKNTNSLCCGLAFGSKGFGVQQSQKRGELISEMANISNNFQIPILFDTSPCFQKTIKTISQMFDGKELPVYDPVQFIEKIVLTKMSGEKIGESISFHLTCSARKLGLEENIKRVLSNISPNFNLIAEADCCGFAGDRGFTHPELTKSALQKVKIKEDVKSGYSTSRMCEIGLSRETGLEFKSIFYLLNIIIK